MREKGEMKEILEGKGSISPGFFQHASKPVQTEINQTLKMIKIEISCSSADEEKGRKKGEEMWGGEKGEEISYHASINLCGNFIEHKYNADRWDYSFLQNIYNIKSHKNSTLNTKIQTLISCCSWELQGLLEKITFAATSWININKAPVWEYKSPEYLSTSVAVSCLYLILVISVSRRLFADHKLC